MEVNDRAKGRGVGEGSSMEKEKVWKQNVKYTYLYIKNTERGETGMWSMENQNEKVLRKNDQQ
jgi:hypothetical protein